MLIPAVKGILVEKTDQSSFLKEMRFLLDRRGRENRGIYTLHNLYIRNYSFLLNCRNDREAAKKFYFCKKDSRNKQERI